MEEFPLALVLASQEEVFSDNNVLYRLVRPLPDGSGVQSTDKLVNVVPFRRVYTFHHKQEVIDFEQLLLARPLVLQPVLHFGRGIGIHCGACYNDEPWVVMINQTHPKILGRFQMGMDLAKQAIEKGQSVEMKFCLTDLIQRIYHEHLLQKESEENKGFTGDLLTHTRFTEWEHADLIIRYHGYEAKSKSKKDRRHHKTFHKTWDFDDIGSHEMQWSQIGQQDFPYPRNSPVYEDELRAVLPSWTINEVSPLNDIGDDIPKQNYSYAQAGRLYESFRKKKRERPHNPTQSRPEQHDNGASIGANSHVEKDQYSPAAIEHDFSYGDDQQSRSLSRARRAYMDHENPHDDYHQIDQMSPYVNYQEGEHYPPGAPGGYEPSAPNYMSSRDGQMYTNDSHPAERGAHPISPRDSKHINANVLIQPSTNSNPQNNNSDLPSNHYLNSIALKKRDSDRSHCSTNADSGFGDGQRSRGDSYDYNDHSRSQPNSKQAMQSYDQRNQSADRGLVNPAFHYNTQEAGVESHKGAIPKNNFHKERGIRDQNHLKTFDEPVVSNGATQLKSGTAESFI